MLHKLFPKERDFFSALEEVSSFLSASVSELLTSIESPQAAEQAIHRVKVLESKAEDIAGLSIGHLHETFVTPFDRSHIFHLVIQLVEICTTTRLIIEKLHLYQVREPLPGTLEVTVQCGELCKTMKKLLMQLQQLRKPGDALRLCLNIRKTRSHVDVLMLNATARLYQNEGDLKKIIKFKEVMDSLILLVGKFEKISFLVEEIVLEYA